MYTKGKWECCVPIDNKSVWAIRTPSEGIIGILKNTDNNEANARRIVHCVNNFDALVKACKKLLEWADKTGKETEEITAILEAAINYAEQALAQVEQKGD